MKKNNSKKKRSGIVQFCIAIFATFLVGLIIVVMSIVSDIQGTARVVNYAGLVRGKTQRIVKLEISNYQKDEMLRDVESFIHGLRNGDEDLQLVRLNDDAFQDKMQELAEYFTVLKKEVYRVREVGADHTDIIPVSEKFFDICDEATGLAEAYSQRKATSLAVTEKYITADIIILMLLIGYELIKAVQYAAQNRSLQKKAYLDSATGLPNKNKCEEILESSEPAANDVGVCSFDLNNLRRINNSRGHKAGDDYIRRFAVCLRQAVPQEHFVGRAGGDEFLVITHGIDETQMKQLLSRIREKMKEESGNYPDTPLSYAVGYALAFNDPDCSMRELFSIADKNMYINKNHVKREEAAAEKRLDFQLLKLVNQHGSNFAACLYCDAKLDTYRIIRAGEDFFLASDGSYLGAVEQIVQEKTEKEYRSSMRVALQFSALQECLKTTGDVVELKYNMTSQESYKRITVIPVDWDDENKLHHFILAFQNIFQSSAEGFDAKEHLTLYYEQLKQSILENDSYVDALLEMADCIYTVNLTKDILEQNIEIKKEPDEHKGLFLNYPLPCSYLDYCHEYKKKVTKETLGSYTMVDSAEKLLKRFETGEKHITVEYCRQEEEEHIRWVQKTVLMTQTVVFDPDLQMEIPIVNAIILLQDTSHMHKQDELKQARLQAAFDEMYVANRSKTEFLSRMSHDIRTPLNGIIGLLKIDEEHFDDRELVLENHKKMHIAADHLLALINDVLQMSKLEEGNIVLSHEVVDLTQLARDVVAIVSARATEAGVKWEYDKGSECSCFFVYGSPLHLRQIFLNIYGNCIKYNHPGGKVMTKVRILDNDDAKCTYQWTISDTGIGMSSEFQKHLFEPFLQEHKDARSVYQGTGLGMTIVKKLIEQMQGTISVSSKEGVGTTFVVTIPFEKAPTPEEAEDVPDKTEADISGLHMLLAEDNELNAEIAKTLLEDNGAFITVVENGKQAVELFKKEPKNTFDAILMDIMMPVMDGLTATREIRTLNRQDAKTIPVIAMTANAFDEDVKECLNAGMNAHLAKPLDMEKAKEVIFDQVKNQVEKANTK